MPMPGQPSQPPVLPGSIAGAPPNPGASPIMAPGGGQGNEAAATELVKKAMTDLFTSMRGFPHEGEKIKAVLAALQSLTKVFADSGEKGLVPQGIMKNAVGVQGGPLANASPPGLANAPPPDKMAA